jgi:hypothetical protein
MLVGTVKKTAPRLLTARQNLGQPKNQQCTPSTFRPPQRLSVTIMSSSSSGHRPASYTEQQIADDNSSIKPRIPSIPQNGRRSDRDSPPQQSSKPSNVGMNHERAASSSQRTNRGVEERRRESVQVTTKTTLTSITRSPNLRHGQSVQLSQRPKPSEASRAHSGDPHPKLGLLEVSQRNTHLS